MKKLLNFEHAVYYHDGKFPPQSIDLAKILPALLSATDAISRYDQMLKNLHNNEILLAPLRNQEAVISSRMEGTISTMDEILQYEADFADDEYSPQVRSDIIETLLYQRTLKNAQQAMMAGYPLSTSLLRTMHEQLLSYGRGANKARANLKKSKIIWRIRLLAIYYLCPSHLSSCLMAWSVCLNTSITTATRFC